MMASEATSVQQPVDVTVTDVSLLHTGSPDHSPQNVDAPTVNGSASFDDVENKQITDIVDELVRSAEVSVSGGSDTEASTSKSGKPSSASLDDRGHGRSSSSAVKKTQSFKSVSVNKTFLGSKNAANSSTRSDSVTAASAVPSTLGNAQGSSASKLKLVAKTGSNSGASKNLPPNGKPSTPDPSTVWNRNRPVPTPEPKKLSDEELMSKYGIHMADRLRPEDDRGQSNWADIDDDEEWAPETITWTDGTKITLPQVDEILPIPPVAPPAVPPKSATPGPAKDMSLIDKPKSPAPSVPSGSAKASPSVKPSGLASGRGLILKPAADKEKPTLVAKAPAPPTPVKSPWAPLPPVEKAPPVVLDPHASQGPPTRGYTPRELPLAISATPPPPPTKEIAADDFSRTPWRDGPAGGNRELFNSQSGRYEPVHDRRGSRHELRMDQHVTNRQPALLQRPSNHDQQQAPAEPSAAFQTSRTSGQDAAPYSRRRNSSNVSGGSIGFLGRPGKPHDMPPPPPPEQPSSTTASTSGIASQSPVASMASQPAQSWQARTPAVQADSTENDLISPGPSEDEIQLQKKLMRERRELAIKRRVEEEEREEAARKERIRLKLEAMGPAPERKSTKREERRELPASIQQRHSGAEGPIPTDEDERPAEATKQVEMELPPTPQSKLEPATSMEQSVSEQINGVPHGQHPPSNIPPPGSLRSGPPPGPQTTSPWPDAYKNAERLPSWSTGPQSTLRNVWGAPGNDRSLGNGTFNAELGGHLADSQPAPPASITARPTPIGPPRSASQGQQQRVDQPSSRLPPIGPPNSRSATDNGHAAGARPRNPWAAADIAADDRAIRRQNQKRLEDYDQKLAHEGLNINEAQVTVRDTWRGVTVNAEGKRTATGTRTRTHGEPKETQPLSTFANTSSPHSLHARPEVPRPMIHEPVQAYLNHHTSEGLGGDFVQLPPAGPGGRAAPGISTSQQRPASSMFFPATGEHGSGRRDRSLGPRSRSPTPPPPTMADHPAYDGDMAHPHVALPPMPIIVKLPPTTDASALSGSREKILNAPAPVVTPLSFAAAAAAAATTALNSRQAVPTSAAGPLASRGRHFGNVIQNSQEIRSQEDWQQRINNLMGRKSNSSSIPASVDSASKSSFDAHASYSATVSLPSLSSVSNLNISPNFITSKEMAEECFGEQEMGALPPVVLPASVPEALWPGKATEPNWFPLHAKYRIDPIAAEPVRFPHEIVNHKSILRIMAPGMGEPKLVLAPFDPRNKSNPRRQGRGGRHVSRGGPRGGRDIGDSNAAPLSDRHDRLDRPSTSRGRGSYRGRSDMWNRQGANAATPTAAQN